VLPLEISLPAPGQGALGIETLAGSPQAGCLAALHCPQTALCVGAERAFSRALGGSCQIPLGAYATFDKDKLRLRGFVATLNGDQRLDEEASTHCAVQDIESAEILGNDLALKLHARGARNILGALLQT